MKVKRSEKIFIEERKNKIFEYIDENERSSIEKIMELFNISRTTARRDLIDLEKRNLVIRTHGGALKKKYFKYEMSIHEKKDLNLSGKKKIAKIARKFISEGDVIFIGGGTTTYELSKLLHDISDLKVVINAVNILLELSYNKNIKIKLLGGDFRQETLSFVGPDTISNMQKYIFDKAFIGANGVSINEGLTTPNELEAIVDGEVVNRSKKIFLLVDDAKFNSIAFSRISEIDKIHYIITNKKLDRKFEEELQNRNIEIVYQ